jgi:mRNA interferase RelE/StbE
VSWAYSFTETAREALRRLDRAAQVRIVRYLDQRIVPAKDPSQFGKPLRGTAHGYWRYRVDDYRIIARIDRGQFHILVVKLGHRSSVYD